MDDLVTILAPVLLSAVAAFATELRPLLKALFKRKGKTVEDAKSPAERLSKLAEHLDEAAGEANAYLKAMAQTVQDRQEAVHALEAQLAGLAKVENDLRTRIKALNETPVQVAEYFATLSDNLSKAGERRSMWRDYGLFVGGAAFSAVSAVVMHQLGWT